jgi:uncharacterized membrane protein
MTQARSPSEDPALVLELTEPEWAALSHHEKKIIDAVTKRLHVARDPNVAFDETRTFAERMADRLAEIGGSWTFVLGFVVMLVVWGLLNLLLLPRAERFDPYPFIFLNLVLSMMSAAQAPIILMSQNRQSAKDRLDSQMDYEVNLKAELEIGQLHAKIDGLIAAVELLKAA